MTDLGAICEICLCKVKRTETYIVCESCMSTPVINKAKLINELERKMKVALNYASLRERYDAEYWRIKAKTYKFLISEIEINFMDRY
jgi:hypothetical protein